MFFPAHYSIIPRTVACRYCTPMLTIETTERRQSYSHHCGTYEAHCESW